MKRMCFPTSKGTSETSTVRVFALCNSSSLALYTQEPILSLSQQALLILIAVPYLSLDVPIF